MTPRPRRLATVATIAALAAGGTVLGAKAWYDERRQAGAAGRNALLSGAVRYELPTRWLLQGRVSEGGAEGLAAFIPCAALDDTPHSANANLLVEANPEAEPLASWSARRFRVAAPRRIEEERTEPAWRTVVSTGTDQGARYVIVERFGVSAKGRLHAVAAFPTLEVAGEGWLDRTGTEIDGFLDSLALAGAPPSAVHVEWDGRTVRLADAAHSPD